MNKSTSKGRVKDNDRLVRLRLLLPKKLHIKDFCYKVKLKTFGYSHGSEVVQPKEFTYTGKFRPQPAHNKDGKLAYVSREYSLFDFYDYLKIKEDISLNQATEFTIYQKVPNQKDPLKKKVAAEWCLRAHNQLTQVEYSVITASNGEPDNTHQKGNFGNAPKAILFFIGGAADKRRYAIFSPNNNIRDAYEAYIKRRMQELSTTQQAKIIDDLNTSYLGYYEVYDKPPNQTNIEANIIAKIPDKQTLIYIIGHSLGGWNGAYITNILSQNGYKVQMLITLDPVGVNKGVTEFSDIYEDYPQVEAEKWINIRCVPSAYNQSDYVADLGGRWIPKAGSGTSYNVISPVHHEDAKGILETVVTKRMTGLDMLINSLRNNL